MASSVIVLLVLAVCAHAQTATDYAELSRLLNEFLAGASRNDVAMHERFWADELIQHGQNNRRPSRRGL